MLKLKHRRKQQQAGFTLVEIAIVLVIIGLLIGGVLKGQSMIQNAKIKRVVRQADELRAAVMTFYDKYGVFPGDENVANIPPGDTVNSATSNGRMEWAERLDLFNDLMLADLISGNYDGTNVPVHAFGGNVYIYWVNPPGPGGYDHYIRYDNLPWDVCLEIDTKYDDGVWNTGAILASEDYVEANSPVGQFYLPF